MMKRLLILMILALATGARAQAVFSQEQILDFYGQPAAPTNPPTNYGRVYIDTTTAQMKCLTSSGGNCLSSAGSGTVTSVGLTVNSGSSSGALAVTGSPITTSGTINLAWTGTSGDIMTFGGSNAPTDSGVLLTALPVLASANTFTNTNDFSTGKFRNYPCAPQFSTSDTLSNATLTSEQFFATQCAIPANSFVANKLLRISLGVDIVSTASPNFNFKIKLCTVSGCQSGTVITVFNGQNGAPTTGTYSNGAILLLQGTAAAAASVAIESSILSQNTTASGPLGRNNQVTNINAVPTNAQLFLQFSITFSTTTGTNSMTLSQLVTEWLN